MEIVMSKTYTPERVTSLKENEVFVFGSNTQGRHGKGAAKQALVSFGAIYGVAQGVQGNSYAVITKDLTSRSLYPLELIAQGINKLYRYAEEHTDKTFLITKLGCGLGGHSVQDISTQFRKLTVPKNVKLPIEFSVTTLKATNKRASMKVQVVNKYKNPDHIYCGRGSALGNPFPITATMTRDEVCDKYQQWFDRKVACNDKDVMEQLDRIKTHGLVHGWVNLGCFCAPKRCHCDTIKAYILGSIANATWLSSKTYAGIGSRSTPDNILNLMSRVGIRLEQLGYTLYSGGAQGADSAFSKDVGKKKVYIPWEGFNNISNGIVKSSVDSLELASKYHPAWNKLSQGARKLMARNMNQILGDDLNSPVDFVICWTPDGAETSTSYSTGGTGQAIRLAIDRGIPVFNLANKDSLTRLATLLGDS